MLAAPALLFNMLAAVNGNDLLCGVFQCFTDLVTLPKLRVVYMHHISKLF